MLKIHVLMLSCLVLLTSCTNPPAACPERPEFTGSTYRDLIIYDKEIRVLYDSCAN